MTRRSDWKLKSAVCGRAVSFVVDAVVVWVFLRRYHLAGLARMLAFGKARIC